MQLSTILISIFVYISHSYANQKFLQKKDNHVPKELSDGQVQYLAGLSDIKHMDQVLNNILIPRVVGTSGHDKVQNYIASQLRKWGWDVEIDEFQENTPNFGRLTFKNIIGTLNPKAERFLVIACHYDSKYFSSEDFIGATDSAVPCAMMLNLIKVMKNDLEQIKTKRDLSLKLIFFDGEEAFKEWTKTDSLYGARHLAKKMDQTNFYTLDNENIKNIQRIDIMVLLDLIGFSRPQFYSFFKPTERWYIRLVDAEQRLAQMGLLNIPQLTFNRRSSNSYIEDDHIPFLLRRVPILHLISTPFPTEWHTSADNRNIVDLQVTENINKFGGRAV
ncbi:glutaminyl-peptide cyclotransferase isoform X2 [Agrilus planipennis]|uniref:Glutaminyl-peptide cyclotransferase n=1 Tax=Agrilus planipennis TaxID=224129 RepID=A0A1W4WLH2_AGRPL|nr:glutaminyl-peptide cyclotransferase isoform X2 [Agrilus planipennis]